MDSARCHQWIPPCGCDYEGCLNPDGYWLIDIPGIFAEITGEGWCPKCGTGLMGGGETVATLKDAVNCILGSGLWIGAVGHSSNEPGDFSHVHQKPGEWFSSWVFRLAAEIARRQVDTQLAERFEKQVHL